MIDVRPALVGDEDELRRLAALAREGAAHGRGGPQLLASLPTPDELVAELDGLLVGTIGGNPMGYAVTVADGRFGRLPELFVEPPARAVGLGAALLDAAIARLRAAGCHWIDSQALPGDRASKNFFEAHGMVTRLLVTHRSLTGTDGHS